MQGLWELWFGLTLALSFPRAQPAELHTGTTVSFPDSGKEFQSCFLSLSISPFFGLTEITLATIKNEFPLSSLGLLRVVGPIFSVIFCWLSGTWSLQFGLSGRVTLASCLAGKISPLFSSEDLSGSCKAVKSPGLLSIRWLRTRYKV